MNKRALEVADRIENSIATTGWRVGEVIGDEATLMSDLGVGRSVLRQCVRLIEHLGVATMLRGRSGGLTIARPGPGPAALSLRLGWSKQRLVKRNADRLAAFIEDWTTSDADGSHVIREVIAEATELASTTTVVLRHDPEAKLGQRTADNILREIIDAAWTGPELLGSEGELMARYGVGRATLREAVQLLDLHEAAIMQRGPGGGLLVLRTPAGGALPRSLRAQLRSRGHDDPAIGALADDLLGILPSAESLPAAEVLRLGLNGLKSILDR